MDVMVRVNGGYDMKEDTEMKISVMKGAKKVNVWKGTVFKVTYEGKRDEESDEECRGDIKTIVKLKGGGDGEGGKEVMMKDKGRCVR